MDNVSDADASLSNIIEFPSDKARDYVTTEDIPAERVLDSISSNNLETVIVLGYTADGEEYFASNTSSGPTILWLIERFKQMLLKVDDDYDD